MSRAILPDEYLRCGSVIVHVDKYLFKFIFFKYRPAVPYGITGESTGTQRGGTAFQFLQDCTSAEATCSNFLIEAG